ncbi:MAG: MATE family efflux transporter [Eubacteriales bacterium]|nr:MATE family efflux transporter [Eubacteriales bacterium]
MKQNNQPTNHTHTQPNSGISSLTKESLLSSMLKFSIPYLIACFLQTFYGLADLFITGQFRGAASISAVSIGSQVMHMLTVMIVGLAMGTTVTISRSIGAGDKKQAAVSIGNSVFIFSLFAIGVTALLLLFHKGILIALSTPQEAMEEARQYLLICFIGTPFITAYNVLSSIFRGLGDTKRPMYFVAAAGVINIGLDAFLLGVVGMGAAGAALATVISQAVSVVLALIALRRNKSGVRVTREDFARDKNMIQMLLGIGFPIAVQEGLIQISFLIITAIANSRGVDVAAAVGIVEKIISFLFLVPSAMLSTVSALAAQNGGAGLHERSRKVLRYGNMICAGFGILVFLMCQVLSVQIVSLFVHNEPEVVRLGGQYLRSYALDCIFAGMHFCFSGFFSAYGKSFYSFIHNIVSIVTIRVPGAYLASILFPATLYPMGLAAPLGSLLSVVICVILYRKNRKNWEITAL